MRIEQKHPPEDEPAGEPATLDYARPTGGRPWWSAADAVLCGLVLCLLGLLLIAPAVIAGGELVGGWRTDFPWPSGLFVLALPAAGLGAICCRAGVQAVRSGLRPNSASHRSSTDSTDSDARQV